MKVSCITLFAIGAIAAPIVERHASGVPALPSFPAPTGGPAAPTGGFSFPAGPRPTGPGGFPGGFHVPTGGFPSFPGGFPAPTDGFSIPSGPRPTGRPGGPGSPVPSRGLRTSAPVFSVAPIPTSV